MLDRFYNQHLVLHDTGEPSYRTFFVISQSCKQAFLDKVSAELNPAESFASTSELGFAARLPLFELFLTLFQARADLLLKQTDDNWRDRIDELISQLEQQIAT